MKTIHSFEQLYQGLVHRILKGKGNSTQEQRQAAFNNDELPGPLGVLIEKVAYHAYKVTDADIAAIKSTGITEDQLFELIICAAVGQASRQYKSGLSALADAIGEGGQYAP